MSVAQLIALDPCRSRFMVLLCSDNAAATDNPVSAHRFAAIASAAQRGAHSPHSHCRNTRSRQALGGPNSMSPFEKLSAVPCAIMECVATDRGSIAFSPKSETAEQARQPLPARWCPASGARPTDDITFR
jgi:hypothetical protein